MALGLGTQSRRHLTELGYLTLSRFILLDPLLLFFTTVCVWLLVKLKNVQDEKGPFTLWWWITLAALGISLGCVSSVKWLGLFTVATVGLFTIYDLWRLLLDPGVTLHKAFPAHFAARAVCLIVLPIATYVFWFWVHFVVLHTEDWSMRDLPSIFHGRFDKPHYGKRYDGMPYDVAYESSQVTLRAARWNGPYLYSNAEQKYPDGSKQQIISSNNYQKSFFTFELMWSRYHEKKAGNADVKARIDYVRNGDFVRLSRCFELFRSILPVKRRLTRFRIAHRPRRHGPQHALSPDQSQPLPARL